VTEDALMPRRVVELVAVLARGRESRRDVIRLLRAVVIIEMAARAQTRRAGINAVLVARRAGLRRVHAREREREVTEDALMPRRVVELVAVLARGRESRRNVIRLFRSVVIGQVTAGAQTRRAGIDAVLVARVAGLGRVHAGQREGLVSETSLRPGVVGQAVARLAGDGEVRRDMIGIGGAVVIGAMAGRAVARPAAINAAAMTGIAIRRDMPAEEQPEVVAVMSVGPAHIGEAMARVARERKACRGMRGIAGAVIVGAMAAHAVARGPGIDVVAMAGRARL